MAKKPNRNGLPFLVCILIVILVSLILLAVSLGQGHTPPLI